VLRLQVQPETTGQRLSNPLLGRDLAAVRGQRVTVGAWVWATRPITLSHGVLINTGGADEPRTEPIALGTEPRFFAWTTSVPEGAQRLQYVVGTDAWSESLEVYVDGAVVVRARPPLDEVPSFDGPGERSVMWGGKSYNNLLRNGSAEEGGPRFRAWLDRPLAYYARRSLSTTLVSILDLERTGRLTFLEVAPGVVDMFFSRFGWGGSLFPGWGWQIVFRGVALLSLAGCAAWLLRRVRLPSPSLPALAFLGLTALVIWGNVVLRIHPLIDTAMPLTSARYGFPAIIPTVLALVGGWLALWPARLRGYGVTLVVVGTLALNVLAVLRIWELYYG
jgi:xanthosine utilization system XapX-like protein